PHGRLLPRRGAGRLDAALRPALGPLAGLAGRQRPRGRPPALLAGGPPDARLGAAPPRQDGQRGPPPPPPPLGALVHGAGGPEHVLRAGRRLRRVPRLAPRRRPPHVPGRPAPRPDGRRRGGGPGPRPLRLPPRRVGAWSGNHAPAEGRVADRPAAR